MTTEYLGVKQVADRLGISTAAVSAYRLPEPDAIIGTACGRLAVDQADMGRKMESNTHVSRSFCLLPVEPDRA